MNIKIRQNYGQIFRELRESKNLSLFQVSGEHFSSAQLSRFELQVSDFTFSKLLHSLDTIRVTPEEFATIIRGYKLSDLEEFAKTCEEYYIKQDIPAIKKLYQKEIELADKKNASLFHELNAISIQALICNLDKTFSVSYKDKKKLSNYLLGASTWGIYEMLLFINSINIFETELIVLLTKEIVAKTNFYHSIPRHKEIIFNILINVSNTCLNRNELKYAEFFLETINQFPLEENNLQQRNCLLYTKGIYKIKTGKVEEGKRLVESSISILEQLECNNTKNLYESHYKEILAYIYIHSKTKSVENHA
ncbi:MAG: hypothetical protein LBT69_02920 [Lactobacillales bacterium]|jgi:Rgg/GadR/MutR family transcriptional activator|nr:hypothetical protein [Lactobacillales bacterium]